MHIPDGYLGPATYMSLWAGTLAVWSWASRKLKDALSVSKVPLLAMASAFSFLVMVFTIPLPGGTSGHISGASLVAILLGPWAAAIAVSIALIIQSLLFGEGGITSIGANCFNIAFVGSFIGYGAYAAIVKSAALVRRKDTDEAAPFSFQGAGVGIGAYLGMNAAALMTAIELGLQPLLYSGAGGTAGYFPFPFAIVVPAVMLPHLTAVGALESIVSVLVFVFLHRKVQPHMTKRSKATGGALLGAFMLLQVPTLSAHEYWIEQKGKDFSLVYGHGSAREEFDVSRVIDIKALDARGQAIDVQKEKIVKGLLLRFSAAPAIILAEVDNGYWSKTIYGWKNLPKRKASRVVEAIRSSNYTKALFAWSDAGQGPAGGVSLDIVPMKNPLDLKAGDFLPLKVTYQGIPVPDLEVEGMDHAKVATTDKNGVTQVRVSKGYQVITVTHKEPLKGDPDADFRSMTTTLTFEVKR